MEMAREERPKSDVIAKGLTTDEWGAYMYEYANLCRLNTRGLLTSEQQRAYEWLGDLKSHLEGGIPFATEISRNRAKVKMESERRWYGCKEGNWW